MRLDQLVAPVPGLAETVAVVAGFDHALCAGLLRPHQNQAAALTGLADAVAGSPLAGRVAEAVDKTLAGAADEAHLTALAAARTALLGAVHDALTDRVDEATGRTREPWTPANAPARPHAPNLRAAARSWLADLARAGWQCGTPDVIAGSAQLIAALLPDPGLRGLAVLLDGFAAELAGADPDDLPERRWADLWARALLLTRPEYGDTLAATTVTGRLLPLGVDLHEHDTAAQAQVHAVLEPADGGPTRLVRASVSVAKPDSVVGMGVWQLLRPHLSLLAAVSEGRSMDIADMPLTTAGDLLWDGERASLGPPADPFATARVALADAIAPAVAPLDRHPVRIAEPVFLEGYHGSKSSTFTFAGQSVDVDVDRLPSAGPLTPALVASSSACIGLVRWDAGTFAVQPLAVETTVKKKTVAIQAGAWAGGTTDPAGVKAEKAADEAVGVLRERAGRLLRG